MTALVLSNELPEDDPALGARDMRTRIAEHRRRKKKDGPRGASAVFLVGVTCGLSAPYVAGMIHEAMAMPTPDEVQGKGKCAAGLAVVGFNPVSLARDAPIEHWAGNKDVRTFRDVAQALERRSREGSRWHAVINPVVGPEAIAGSSRMKGGSASVMLLDAICLMALSKAGILSAVDGIRCEKGMAHVFQWYHDSCMKAYAHAEALGAVMTRAAEALRGQRDVCTTPQKLQSGGVLNIVTKESAAATAAAAATPPKAAGSGAEEALQSANATQSFNATGEGRVFYVGDGTAGLLGVMDASEVNKRTNERTNKRD